MSVRASAVEDAVRSNLSAGRSDHLVFGSVGVPALSLTTGFHSHYHRVTDVPS